MSFLRRGPAPVQCFFCHRTLKAQPLDPRAFRCPHCECWNKYDQNGEIMADEPAVRDEALNTISFAKRASIDNNKLPVTFNKGSIFCRTCQTNQTLYINLLSNYLPEEDDPSYERLCTQLPAYKASLDARYPTVCKDCIGGVEEEIRKAERKARANALGGWLRDGKRNSQVKIEIPTRDVLLWRIRGVLWISTLLASVGGTLATLSDISIPWVHPYWLPPITLSSFLWTFWDPSWHKVQLSKRNGIAPRTSGRNIWINHQLRIYISRVLTSFLIALAYTPKGWFALTLVFEIISTVLSFLAIAIVKPPSVRLGRTDSPSALEPYPTKVIRSTSNNLSTSHHEPQPDDLFSTLTLAATPLHTIPTSTPTLDQNPDLKLKQPIFGRTSAPRDPAPRTPSPIEESMDWTPSNPNPFLSNTSPSKPQQRESESWLRPQRFFAPQEPTGLEDLFAQQVKLMDGDGLNAAPGVHFPTRGKVFRAARGGGASRWSLLVLQVTALFVVSVIVGAAGVRIGMWEALGRWYQSTISSGLTSTPSSETFSSPIDFSHAGGWEPE